MKKRFALLTLIAFLSAGNLSVFAQNGLLSKVTSVFDKDTTNNQEFSTEDKAIEEIAENETTEESSSDEVATTEEETFHQIIKQKFMEVT